MVVQASVGGAGAECLSCSFSSVGDRNYSFFDADLSHKWGHCWQVSLLTDGSVL